MIRETHIDPSLNGTLKGNHQLLEFGFVDIWERLGRAAMSNGVSGFHRAGPAQLIKRGRRSRRRDLFDRFSIPCGDSSELTFVNL